MTFKLIPLLMTLLLLAGCSNDAKQENETLPQDQILQAIKEEGLNIQEIKEPTYFPLNDVKPHCYSINSDVKQRLCMYIFNSTKELQLGLDIFEQKKKLLTGEAVLPQIFSYKNISVFYIARDSNKNDEHIKRAMDSVITK